MNSETTLALNAAVSKKPIATTWDRTKDLLTPYWVDEYGIIKEVTWDKAPIGNHPLVWGDRPVAKERLKELFDQADGNPLKFARLIELEHGIRAYAQASS